ncbi:DUF4190 domain-containing protein [Streptomyces sp. NPDC059909]|uniref:DUF4190 domain-containing protein n=1 Tax=Streptomyces sp. NPDC059909 TaxID=3346998 RepID=UPI00365DA952
MPEQSDRPPGGYEPNDPWAPPERRASQGGQDRVDLGKTAPDAQPGRPAVHDQPTVTSTPSAGVPGTGPETGDAGAVPPPPIAPGGPAQPAPGPYGYPAAPGTPGYGYPAAPGAQPGAPGYGYPGYPGYSGSWTMGTQPQNGMGTAAMVLGILAVCLFCMYGIPSLILGALALIFGIIGRKRYQRGEANNKGQALAGIILGSVGIALGAAIIAFFAWIIVNADEWEESGVDEDPWATTLVVDAAPR